MAENHSCSGNCGECGSREKEQFAECEMRRQLARISHKIVVMSGKGGVGKSTVAVNLAMALTLAGKKVGLLDVDLHGPSVPTMLHLERNLYGTEEGRILPVEIGDLKVMSVGVLLPDADAAVIWRGPMKIGVIRQLLADVEWGDLDYLVVDCPPGTGDEPLSICQMLPDADGAVIVTTPQQVAAADVIKSLDFCKRLNFPVIGIIENMSGFVCPKCGELTEIFASGAGEALAARCGVPLLGRIPIDPAVCRGGDTGQPFINSAGGSVAAEVFRKIVGQIAGVELK